MRRHLALQMPQQRILLSNALMRGHVRRSPGSFKGGHQGLESRFSARYDWTSKLECCGLTRVHLTTPLLRYHERSGVLMYASLATSRLLRVPSSMYCLRR